MNPEDELKLLKDIEQAKKHYFFLVLENDEGIFLCNSEDEFIRDNLKAVKKEDGKTYYKSKDVTELLPNIIRFELIKNNH
jgi:hypothetical protein